MMGLLRSLRYKLFPVGWASQRVGFQLMMVYLVLGPPLYIKSWASWIGPSVCYPATAGCVVIDPTVGGSLLRAIDRIGGDILALLFAMIIGIPVWIAGYKSLIDNPWLRWFFFANGIACAFYWGYANFLLGEEKHLLLLFSGITISLFMYALYEDDWMWATWMCFLTNLVGCVVGHIIFAVVFPVTVTEVAEEELVSAMKNLALLCHFLVDVIAGSGTAVVDLLHHRRLSAALSKALDTRQSKFSPSPLSIPRFRTSVENGVPNVEPYYPDADSYSEHPSLDNVHLNEVGAVDAPSSESRFLAPIAADQHRRSDLRNSFRDTNVVGDRERLASILSTEHMTLEDFRQLLDKKLQDTWQVLSVQRNRHRSAAFEFLKKNTVENQTKHEKMVNCCYKIFHFIARLHNALKVRDAHFYNADGATDSWLTRSQSILSGYLSKSRVDLGSLDSSVTMRQHVSQTHLAHYLSAPALSAMPGVQGGLPEFQQTPSTDRVDVDWVNWERHCDAVEDMVLVQFGPIYNEVALAMGKVLLMYGQLIAQRRNEMTDHEVRLVKGMDQAVQSMAEQRNYIRRQFERVLKDAQEGRPFEDEQEFILMATGASISEFMMLPPELRKYIWQRWGETTDRLNSTTHLLLSMHLAVSEFGLHVLNWVNYRLKSRESKHCWRFWRWGIG